MSGRAFVDSNVLLYAFDSSSPHHAPSRALLERSKALDGNLWVSPQIFCEVYRYLTHPSAQNQRDPADVRDELAAVFARPGIERRVRLSEGRVLTSAGLRCHLNDIAGIRASSARLARTATGSTR